MIITDPDQLVVGVNLGINVFSRRINISPGGAVTADARVAWSALRSKLAALWLGSPYASHPFPLAVSADGEYLVGTDGAEFNGWHLATGTDAYMAGAPWVEYDATGVLLRRYLHLRSDQPDPDLEWYWFSPIDSVRRLIPRRGSLDGGLRIFDSSGADYTSGLITVLSRTRGKTYAEFSVDLSQSSRRVTLLPSIFDDPMVVDSDYLIENSLKYTGITLRHYETDQFREVDSGGLQPMPFRTVIDAAGATLDTVYQWMQWASRQLVDLNAEAVPDWVGATRPALVSAAHRGVITLGRGVFIDNLPMRDWGRVYLQANTGAACWLPWSPAAPDIERLHSVVVDVHRIHGLDPAAPLQVSATQRSAGDIEQTIVDAAGTVTVTRAP